MLYALAEQAGLLTEREVEERVTGKDILRWGFYWREKARRERAAMERHSKGGR